ncbi:MAG TPA: methyltransferase [Candidatus Limnocylindrales bacterium]|nr:methyltransferase [Candidatus Limnocylindrales bacterium]
MKYGIIPEGMAERVALRTGRIPAPVIDVLYGPLQARAIMAAANVGVFDALAKGPAGVADLAAALRVNAGCLEALLRTLVHAGYLRLDGDGFELSRLGRRAIERNRGYIEWNRTQWDMLAQLEATVRTGRGVDLHATLRDPEAWDNYQRGQAEIARDVATYVAAKVPVRRGARRLVDLGGSHGLFGAAICRKHPPLRSTVLELPEAIEAARRIAEESRIVDVVEFRACDILRERPGADHDVALLANVMHHFTPEQNAALMARVAEAVLPGGTVAIWEFEKPRNRKPGVADVLELYFRLTSDAGVYSAEELRGWMAAAGLGSVRVIRPLLFPGYSLLIGRKE